VIGEEKRREEDVPATQTHIILSHIQYDATYILGIVVIMVYVICVWYEFAVITA